MPRLFLSGPHLDMFPPAYPEDAYVVRDATEAVNQVNKLCDAGATVIKVYFRLPPGIIHEICKTAHSRGVPVTAHLEITEAMEAKIKKNALKYPADQVRGRRLVRGGTALRAHPRQRGLELLVVEEAVEQRVAAGEELPRELHTRQAGAPSRPPDRAAEADETMPLPR